MRIGGAKQMNIEEARKALEYVARQEGVSVAHVEAEIRKAMLCGMNNNDPQVRAYWDSIPCVGVSPTPEEFIVWMVGRLTEKTAMQ